MRISSSTRHKPSRWLIDSMGTLIIIQAMLISHSAAFQRHLKHLEITKFAHQCTTSLQLRCSSLANNDIPSSSVSATTKTTAPWNHPRVFYASQQRRRRNSNKARFRQHVNPLARQYQQPCDLPLDWPLTVFQDVSKPLHIDIGCGKGGFLIDLATAAANTSNKTKQSLNYLGLEIRPLVARYARERIQDNVLLKDQLEFVGCNANVDLDRLLSMYASASDRRASDGVLDMLSIQFPDPHFKSYQAKRRLVTPALVDVIARYLQRSFGQVFLQSDIQSVLDDMRCQFANSNEYFQDAKPIDEYLETNIFEIPTEREVSVLERDLPVYRALFTRTDVPYRYPSSFD